jgi:hypothetical protein
MELAAVTLIQLYRTVEWRDAYYLAKSEGLTAFLTRCVDRLEIPEPTDLQSRLSQLLGEAGEAHLYFSRYEAKTPTHYIPIIKGDDGLWRLRHTKIRAVSRGGRLTFGAIISWRTITPIPDVAIDIEPQLTPLARGKTAFDQFSAAVINDETTRRQLSHAIILMRLYGALRAKSVPVWFPGSDGLFDSCTRISFAIQPDSGDGWLEPFIFAPCTIRKGVSFSAKKNVSIIGHFVHSSIRPTSPKLRPVEDYQLGDMKFVLEQLFNSHIVPYVGVSLDNKTVDLYSMFYFPDENETSIVKIAEGRRMANCETLPVITPWPGYDGVWVPNEVLATILHRLINFPDTARVMPYFGASKTDSYNKVFSRYNLSLSDEELQALKGEVNE